MSLAIGNRISDFIQIAPHVIVSESSLELCGTGTLEGEKGECVVAVGSHCNVERFGKRWSTRSPEKYLSYEAISIRPWPERLNNITFSSPVSLQRSASRTAAAEADAWQISI